MFINICEVLREKADTVPSNTAIADKDRSLTYKELDELTDTISINLFGVLNGEYNRPIAVFIEKSIECLACFFGVAKSGNFYVCIDMKMAPERINTIFGELNPSAIIVNKDIELPFENKFRVIKYSDLLGTDYDEGAVVKRDEAFSRVIDTDPLYLLYTSGSTGIPKGSVISHKSALAYAEWVVDAFNLDDTTVFGSQTPFYFSMSVLDIYACLMCGGALTIIPKVYFSFPIKLLQYLNEKQINTIYWVPTALSIVANTGSLEYECPKHLKRILFAGEVMPTRQLNIWRKHLPHVIYANLFGPTEITDIALYYVLNREFKDSEPIPIGKVCRNMDAFALNENGEPIKGDEIGELYFRGSFVGHGYYNSPEKTAQAFVQNPLNKAYPEIVYKTGDLVRINEYGEFMYAGRSDFQIKHMGYRIELGEIENAASSNTEVDACACLFDAAKDEIVLIYQGKTDDTELYSYLKAYLPEYMRPGRMVRVDAMPHNANGKIDRQKLSKEHLSQKG